MARWVRLYTDCLNNPKVQRLPGDLFKFWVNCLCVAGDDDGWLPEIADIAFKHRLPEVKATAHLRALVAAELVDDMTGGRYRMHDWETHQYASDTSAERVREFRKRQRAVTRNDDVTLQPPLQKRPGNALDTDTDTDTDTDQKTVLASQAPPNDAAKRGSRLPADWKPTPEDVAFAEREGWPPDDWAREAAKFRDFWHAKPGAAGRKLDWSATWRNWLRNADRGRAPPAGRGVNLADVMALAERKARDATA